MEFASNGLSRRLRGPVLGRNTTKYPCPIACAFLRRTPPQLIQISYSPWGFRLSLPASDLLNHLEAVTWKIRA
ncbi:protein of unknown function [Azospirillum baldaniorum]|uniref:Uncharacterized protein n=1 Tax=Azospirillum baldaniorum TaxID=1064539 RepID=A0A9P1NM70_9PROT|nr:protein of unknown function [Azospirillum baldaniorum]